MTMLLLLLSEGIEAVKRRVQEGLDQLVSIQIKDEFEFKELLEGAYTLLNSPRIDIEGYNLALSVICHCADRFPLDSLVTNLLLECIASSRVFLYEEMLLEKHSDLKLLTSPYNLFAKATYTRDTLTVLTRDQQNLYDIFKKKKRVVVSAPTSFGKSRLVQEIISDGHYTNICIVLPTNALLNETFLRLKSAPKLSSYQLVSSLWQLELSAKNIFILTPEKTDVLLDTYPELEIDFFVMDEIYKIQDDKDRRQIFTHCLYRLIQHHCDFYLIGPYFKDFSSTFLRSTGSIFVKYDSEVVQKDTFDIAKVPNGDYYTIGTKQIRKYKDKKRNLKELFQALNEQTLIYAGKRSTVETLATYLSEDRESSLQSSLVEYIEKNIHDEWSLVKCLKTGVGFHHSALPRFIQSEIVEEFNNGELSAIVCTSTLTEGVNTSAKNVILYDNEKGKTSLSGFDVKNIRGRAGRFHRHFIGNVFYLAHFQDLADHDAISFDYMDNATLPDEEIIQLKQQDVTDNNASRRVQILKDLDRLMIPIQVIMNNKFISIQSQIGLIQHLRSSDEVLNLIHSEVNIPRNESLKRVLELSREFLFSHSDKTQKYFWPDELIQHTLNQFYFTPSLRGIIERMKSQNIDTRIRNAFYLVTHFFEFAIPRYLNAFERLFNFVYEEKHPGKTGLSLSLVITKLQFGFINAHEIALREAGLPRELVSKISQDLAECQSILEIRNKLEQEASILSKLTNFEQHLIRKYV